MSLQIRKANIDDLESLRELYLGIREHHIAIDENYRDLDDYAQDVEKEVREVLEDSKKRVIMAFDGESAIGFGIFNIVYKRLYKNPYFGYLYKAFVKDEYRGKGVFKNIFEKGVEWCKAKGAEYMELTCDTDNELGQNTWNALGFKEVKKIMRRKI